MESLGIHGLKTYTHDTVQTLAQQMGVKLIENLSDKQKAALEKVLQDAKTVVTASTSETIQPAQSIQQQYAGQKQYTGQQQYTGQRQYTGQKQYTEQQQRPTQQRQQYESTGNKIGTIQNMFLYVLLIISLSFAGFFSWYYLWTSQAVFDLKVQPVVTLAGQAVRPDDFLLPMENMENVTVVFRNPLFKPSIGSQDVDLTIIVGRRVIKASTSLHIFNTVNQMKHEFAKTGPELKPTDFLENAAIIANVPVDIRFTEDTMPLENYSVGEHILHITLNKLPFEVRLIVEDTTPPEAEKVDLTIMIGEEVKPEDFVTNITDASDHLPISITYYEAEPNIFGNDQIIAIKVMDYYGNYTVVHSRLAVRHNNEHPVITGTNTIFSDLGNPIDYMQGVIAFDDLGRDLTESIIVDDSGVDYNEIGIYTVYYKVTDFTGLTFEIMETVHVTDFIADFVNERIDMIFADIIDDEMTQLDQVRAIFNWIRSNVSFAISMEEPETLYLGAYSAIRERRGNSYVFSSISEAMLTRAGIANQSIERVPDANVSHRWNLVNPDGLGWHHFDSFPSPFGAGIQKAFFTDSQAKAFSEHSADHPEHNYYTYNPELYPEIV
ncbi:MAG: DUF5011 domain-containing protein [Oscillospiraceae bacterium]|jgi:hypothetical protein|nr:DUF5011 domain-containing protein [Oscillospiraceae bacterium]